MYTQHCSSITRCGDCLLFQFSFLPRVGPVHGRDMKIWQKKGKQIYYIYFFMYAQLFSQKILFVYQRIMKYDCKCKFWCDWMNKLSWSKVQWPISSISLRGKNFCGVSKTYLKSIFKTIKECHKKFIVIISSYT